MTNKTTRRALFTSAMAMLICIAMLVGTTFAWFTDSVTSGKNTIVAGNLDVELEYKTDWNDDWAPVTNTTKIFKEGALYEPGYTEVVYLRVANKGTLALKYNLSVNVADEQASTNVYGEKFNLSDYLMYGTYVQDEFSSGFNYANILMPTMFGTREAALSNVKQLTKLSEAEIVIDDNAPVLAGDNASRVAVIVLTMPETVGNEANHKTGVEAPTIDLGVNLVATQFTEESDSFDNQYDKNATLDDAKLTHGGVIDLDDNLTDEVTIAKDADVVINATDKTINNVVTNNGDLTVNGGTIESTGANAIYNEGEAEFNGTTMNMTENSGYIINGRNNGSETVFEDVNITSSGGGINVWQGEATFKSGTITINSTSTSQRHVFYVYDGAKLTIEDGEFFFNPTNLKRKGSYICANENAVVEVLGGTFHKPSTRTAPIQAVNGSTVTIKGGKFQFDPSEFVADGYQAVLGTDGWWTVTK